ncbi:MAG: hypothetical protein ABIS39_02410 [Sphingomicrobium sp.]
MTRPDKTTWILLGGFAALLLIILFFTLRDAGEQDRLDDGAATSLPDAETDAAGCSGNQVLGALKTALFRQAGANRLNDAAAFDQIARAAVVRMENAALEDELADRLDCTGALAIDLPPGIVAPGGRRNLMGNVDYSVSSQTGDITIRNASALVGALSGLERSSGGVSQPLGGDPLTNQVVVEPGEPVEPSDPQPSANARPSFDCSRARTRGEQAICADPGLAALDRQLAAQYGRAMAGVLPDRQALLRQTRDRFLAYRDSCPNDGCIADAYRGRMQEISDILAGRWQPPR